MASRRGARAKKASASAGAEDEEVIASVTTKREREEENGIESLSSSLATSDAKKQKSDAGLYTKASINLSRATNKFKHMTLPEGWKCIEDSCVFIDYTPSGTKPNFTSGKVAGFDYDGCIYRNAHFMFSDKSPAKFPSDFMHPNVGPVLMGLHDEGYRVVVFSNESIARFKDPKVIEEKLLLKISRCQSLLDYCGVPMQVYLALFNDDYRKPASPAKGKKDKGGGTKMWSLMDEFSMSKGFVESDRSKSLFVGDAAGRKQDHSDCDKEFARLLSVDYYDESCFANFPVKFSKPLSSFVSSASSAATAIPGSMVQISSITVSKLPKLLLTVGIAASGKSTLGNKLIKHLGEEKIVRYSQDLLKTKDKVERKVIEAIEQGENAPDVIIIDRTNVDKDQRSHWIKLAKKHKVDIEAVVLKRSLADCIERAVKRTDHEDPKFPSGEEKRGELGKLLSMMNSKWEDPSLDEGFVRISTLYSDDHADEWLEKYLEDFKSLSR